MIGVVFAKCANRTRGTRWPYKCHTNTVWERLTVRPWKWPCLFIVFLPFAQGLFRSELLHWVILNSNTCFFFTVISPFGEDDLIWATCNIPKQYSGCEDPSLIFWGVQYADMLSYCFRYYYWILWEDLHNATWNIVTKAFPSFSLKLFERNSLMHIWGKWQNLQICFKMLQRRHKREGGRELN